MKTSPATDADTTDYDTGYCAIGYPRWGTSDDGGDD